MQEEQICKRRLPIFSAPTKCVVSPVKVGVEKCGGIGQLPPVALPSTPRCFLSAYRARTIVYILLLWTSFVAYHKPY